MCRSTSAIADYGPHDSLQVPLACIKLLRQELLFRDQKAWQAIAASTTARRLHSNTVHQSSATNAQFDFAHLSFDGILRLKGSLIVPLVLVLMGGCWIESRHEPQYGNLLAAKLPSSLGHSLTPYRQWKRIRSHVSPKDELPDFLATSAAKSRRPLGSTPSAPQRGRTPAANNPQEPETASRGPSPFSSYHVEISGTEQVPIDELGLHVVFQPPSAALVDLIFVHGLGGASHRTWSKNQDHNLFWPQQWLPLEPDICSARILTFGYNARFRSGGPQNMNIADFAKDLLFGLKFGKGADTEDLGIGKVLAQNSLGCALC